MDDINKEIGWKIRKLREQHEDTLTSLGKAVNFNFSNLSKIERGERRADADLLKRIATHYDVPVSYFFGEEVNLPQELKDLGVDWIAFSEEMKKDGLTPEEIRRYVEIVKQLKGNLS